MKMSLAPGRLLLRFLASNAGLALGFAVAALAALTGVASASEMDLQIPAINTTTTTSVGRASATARLPECFGPK